MKKFLPRVWFYREITTEIPDYAHEENILHFRISVPIIYNKISDKLSMKFTFFQLCDFIPQIFFQHCENWALLLIVLLRIVLYKFLPAVYPLPHCTKLNKKISYKFLNYLLLKLWYFRNILQVLTVNYYLLMIFKKDIF